MIVAGPRPMVLGGPSWERQLSSALKRDTADGTLGTLAEAVEMAIAADPDHIMLIAVRKMPRD